MLESSDFEHNREDLAINCLLEEDQKDFMSSFNWENPKSNNKKLNQVASYLDFKFTRPRNLFNRNQNNKDIRSRYNPEMLEGTDPHQALHDARHLHREENKECIDMENQGAYWCSKINWTSVGFKEPKSQNKLTKRFSMGEEAYQPPSRRSSSRYELYDKSRDEEYKANLIYNILKAESDRLKQEESKLKSVLNYSAGGSVDAIRVRDRKTPSNRNHKILKQKHQGVNLSRYMQQSMRQALQKLWQNSHEHNEYHLFSPDKRVEINRSSAIREILMNLEKSKTKPQPFQDKNHSNQILQQCSKLVIKQKKKEVSHPPERIQSQSLTNRNHRVVNINIQAERVYKSRSVNRKHIKQ